jgi:hypothetical protein
MLFCGGGREIEGWDGQGDENDWHGVPVVDEGDVKLDFTR